MQTAMMTSARAGSVTRHKSTSLARIVSNVHHGQVTSLDWRRQELFLTSMSTLLPESRDLGRETTSLARSYCWLPTYRLSPCQCQYNARWGGSFAPVTHVL